MDDTASITVSTEFDPAMKDVRFKNTDMNSNNIDFCQKHISDVAYDYVMELDSLNLNEHA